MLVLTRKVGEVIVIGDNVTLTIASIDKGKVRVGIVAPKSVRVDRSEIHDRRAQEQTLDRPAEAAPPRRAGIKRFRLV